jgi:hypothetical protein
MNIHWGNLGTIEYHSYPYWTFDCFEAQHLSLEASVGSKILI